MQKLIITIEYHHYSGESADRVQQARKEGTVKPQGKGDF